MRNVQIDKTLFYQGYTFNRGAVKGKTFNVSMAPEIPLLSLSLRNV